MRQGRRGEGGLIIVHDLQVHRAQRIFDQYHAFELPRYEAAAMLMKAFGLELCEAELLLDEVSGQNVTYSAI